jgi:hypothetical protein
MPVAFPGGEFNRDVSKLRLPNSLAIRPHADPPGAPSAGKVNVNECYRDVSTSIQTQSMVVGFFELWVDLVRQGGNEIGFFDQLSQVA